MTEQPAGALERREDAGKGEKGFVKLWLDAFAIADKEEEEWRKRARATVDTYRDEKDGKGLENRQRRFNILYTNVETQLPALYNSTPTPDVRRRFADEDPVAKIGAQIIERALSYSVDSYDFDCTMTDAVRDMLLPGRGVTRVRYEPFLDNESGVVYEQVTCEHVPWQCFRRGPGRRWEDVPWIAFDHFLTREKLVELAGPKIGRAVPLDVTVNGADERYKDAKEPPSLFMRAHVREVWDREKRQVLFIAPGFAAQPLRIEEDPLGLEGFFPVPRPLYAVATTDSLVPVEEYRLYKDQAEELDRITRRITSLVRVLKWRGVYPASEENSGLMTALANAEDGQLVPAQNLMSLVAQQGGLDKAIWMMPIEQAANVLTALYEQREQIKRTIFEITGLADIMRGATEAEETATAQQIKAQWGSLRVQKRQAEIQRYARDLFRLKAEIICTKFSWQTLEMISGISLPSAMQKRQAVEAAAQQAQEALPPEVEQILSSPTREEVEQLLRADVMRQYRIDIETDSTIRADLTRSQQTMAQFVEGSGQFMQGVAPAVQSGFVPPDIAAEIFAAFARQFKLGKQAEDALDRLAQHGKRMAAAPPQEDPALAVEKAKAAAEMEKLQLEGELAKAKHAMELERMRAEVEHDRAKLAIEQEKLQLQQQKAQLDAQATAQKAALQQEQMAAEQEMAREGMVMEQEARREEMAMAREERQLKRADQEDAFRLKQRERRMKAKESKGK